MDRRVWKGVYQSTFLIKGVEFGERKTCAQF